MMLKKNNSFKNGIHLNSKYWQDYKKSICPIPQNLFDISIGCMLGDACMYRVSKDSKLKFEQGYMHKDYLFYIFNLFEQYTFHEEPYTRLEIRGPRKGLVKSYSFRTFTHPSFNPIWDLFMKDGKKIIKPGLVSDYLTAEGLAYWIMDDGSLQNDGKSIILHTQSYTQDEVLNLSLELNSKFNLDSKVIPHKKKYWVIFIPKTNFDIIFNLVSPHIHPSMSYKLGL